MNVLYILCSTRSVGGASKAFLTLVSGMVEKGVTPFVVTPDKGDMFNILRDKGIFVTAINLRSRIYPNFSSVKDRLFFFPRILCRIFIEWRASRQIFHICKKHKINLIHANVSILSCGFYASRKLHIPHIVHVREYMDERSGFHYFPNKRAYYKTLNTKNSYMICITRGIQEFLHLTDKNSKVVYDGIEPHINKQHSEFPQGSFFLFAGRMEPNKNPLQVVKAFHIFCQRHPENHMTLKLAGAEEDIVYMANLKDFIRQNKLSDKVQFLGIRKDIRRLMLDARALIVSSTFEGFGLCLPEAMLSKCLTIGKDTTGTKEQFDNGVKLFGEEIGLRYQTTEELADRMEELWPDIPERYEAMKERAYSAVKKMYSKESNVNNIYSFYQNICVNGTY